MINYSPVLLMQFKLFVGQYQRSDWYNVMVFQTKQFMWNFWKEQIRIEPNIAPNYRQKKTDFLAITNHWTSVSIEDGKELFLPQCGQVLFYKGSVGPGIVSHEMTHASLYWHNINVKNFNPMDNNKHDESLAWVQGHLVNQFWHRWYAKKDKLEKNSASKI